MQKQSITQALDKSSFSFKLSPRAAAGGSTVSDSVEVYLYAVHAVAYSCMVIPEKAIRDKETIRKGISRQGRRWRATGGQVAKPSF